MSPLGRKWSTKEKACNTVNSKPIPFDEPKFDRTRRAAVVPLLGALSLVVVGGCDRLESQSESDTDLGEPDSGAAQMAPNQLSAEEAADGFELLFDGASLEAWRGFRMETAPAGWGASEGSLAFTPGQGGGDLITRSTYSDFDLRLEWKVGPRGNSGIFFAVSEETRRTFESGPEMQILDNSEHPDGQSALTSAGSNYGLHAPPEDVTRPVGEWNEARIVREGNRVRQWLNGSLQVDYELGSDEWNALVAGSKFVEWPEYGTYHEGHIGLQDHGDPVEFRNLRIRRLAPQD